MFTVLYIFYNNGDRYSVDKCDPEQEITKKIALKAGFEYKGIEEDLCVYVKE